MDIPAYVEELEALGGAGTPARLIEQVRDAEPASVGLARSLFGRWLERVVGLPGHAAGPSAPAAASTDAPSRA